MSAKPFTPEGNTVLITAAVTAPTPVQVASNTLGGNQYRVINNGAVTAFLGFGANAATATTNAVAPTSGSGNSTFSIPLLAGTDEILSFLPNMYATAVTLSSTATIYITPGDGT
jgi:hypothetical protein